MGPYEADMGPHGPHVAPYMDPSWGPYGTPMGPYGNAMFVMWGCALSWFWW